MTDKFRNKYRIASSRAAWWDYSKNGKYFITINTAGRKHYFGKIENSEMILSEIGKRARQNWLDNQLHFSHVILDEFVVMPDHFHGIIIIDNQDDGINDIYFDKNVYAETGHALSLSHPRCHQPHPRFGNQGKNTVSAMVGSFKSAVTKWCHENNFQFGWQTRFHDHIIRNDEEFNRIQKYIMNNPSNWRG